MSGDHRDLHVLTHAFPPRRSSDLFAGRRRIAVTSHRRENFGEGMKAIADAITGIAGRDDVAVVFPVHPNPHVRSAMEPILGDLPNVALIDPLDYPHFVRLLGMSSLVLTDSGGVQEEEIGRASGRERGCR